MGEQITRPQSGSAHRLYTDISGLGLEMDSSKEARLHDMQNLANLSRCTIQKQ